MPRQLLNEAVEQAQTSSPAVRAMALLHIARVLTAIDRDEAQRTLAQAVEEIDALPPAEREPAMNDVVSLIATVSPQEAFRRLPSLEREWRQVDWILINMMDHGHAAEVVSYLGNPSRDLPYPSMAMSQALGHSQRDPDAQRTILRGAMRAMREAALRDDLSAMFGATRSEFARAFVYHWKALPRDEASEFLREYADWILREPDERADHKLSDPSRTVRFSSRRQRELFEILGPLRELEPALAESLIRNHDQLAKAAALFPNGFEEALANENSDSGQTLPSEPIEWDDVTYQWIPVRQWLETTYDVLFNAALDLYATDTAPGNPNRAPREVWPSTQAFRALFHRVGRHEGRAAAARLERIPDPDLRLFAKIELAAAVAGLHPIGGSQRPPQTPQHSAEEAELTSLDLAALPVRWKERGHARQVRTQVVEWDRDLQQWAPPRITAVSSYAPDGLMTETREQHVKGPWSHVQYEYDSQGALQRVRSTVNGNTTTFECFYDGAGQLVSVSSNGRIRKESPEKFDFFHSGLSCGSSWCSLEFRIGDEGIKVHDVASVLIEYDEKQRPAEVSFLGQGESSLGTSRRTWSDSGVLVKEEFTAAQPVISEILEEEDEGAFALATAPWITTLVHDEQGHCVHRETLLSGDSVSRVESRYNDFGDPVEQRITDPAFISARELRYEYVYDALGNWTERVLRTKSGSNTEYKPSSIERREIEYF